MITPGHVVEMHADYCAKDSSLRRIRGLWSGVKTVCLERPLAPGPEKLRQGRVHHLHWLPAVWWDGLYHKQQGVCLVVMRKTWGGAGGGQPVLVFRPQTDG